MQLGNLLVYCLAVLAFSAGFTLLRIVATARQALAVGHLAIGVIRSADLNDLEKERKIQRLSLVMLKNLGATTIKSVVLIVVTSLPVLGAARLGFIDIGRFLAFSLRWDVVLLTLIVLTGAAFALRRPQRSGTP